MDGKPYKLRIKIGSSEFEAEGDQEMVKEQYRLFLDVLSSTSTGDQETARETASNGDSGRVQESGQEQIGPVTLGRAYSEVKDLVSLRALPEGESGQADALLLILYGYLVLRDQHSVNSTELMKAARQSGLQIDRTDRVMSQHKGLFIRGGARKGTRYTLNNRGETRAKQILRDVFMS